MIGTVPGRSMTVPVQPLVAGQQPVERREEIVVGAGADLDHDEAGRGVRDEHRQQPVAAAGRLGGLGNKPGALARQVEEPAPRPRPDRQFAADYGKMLRSASRRRPRPPIAGAES